MSAKVSGHPYLSLPFSPQKAAARRHRRRPDIPARLPWVLMDRRLAVLDPVFPNLVTLPSFPSAATEDGKVVSLYLASPPNPSLGFLLDGFPLVRPGWRKPTILAADAGRLLLHVPVPPRVDLLTFTGGLQSSLELIPSRADFDVGNLSVSRGAGFLSDGDDYKVAFLRTWVSWCGKVQQETARVDIFSSASRSWNTVSLDMPWTRPPPGVEWTAWRLDAAVSYRDCVSWVDYSLGLITCDVLNEAPALHFLSLPVITPRSPSSWMYNSLCVSEELLRFLCITAGPGPHEATIKLWTLDTDGYCWREDGGVVLNCGGSLPKGLLLSGPDANVLFFLLEQGPLKWVYSINWRVPNVLARYPYREDLSRGAAVDTPFVGSELALYVNYPPVLPVAPADEAGDLNLRGLVPTVGRIKAKKTD